MRSNSSLGISLRSLGRKKTKTISVTLKIWMHYSDILASCVVVVNFPISGVKCSVRFEIPEKKARNNIDHH